MMDADISRVIKKTSPLIVLISVIGIITLICFAIGCADLLHLCVSKPNPNDGYYSAFFTGFGSVAGTLAAFGTFFSAILTFYLVLLQRKQIKWQKEQNEKETIRKSYQFALDEVRRIEYRSNAAWLKGHQAIKLISSELERISKREDSPEGHNPDEDMFICTLAIDAIFSYAQELHYYKGCIESYEEGSKEYFKRVIVKSTPRYFQKIIAFSKEIQKDADIPLYDDMRHDLDEALNMYDEIRDLCL